LGVKIFFAAPRKGAGQRSRKMPIAKLKDGRLLVNIGDHWISDGDMGEVTRRFKEIETSVNTATEKERQKEGVLKEYDSCCNKNK
jgi:hypothetical protein